MSGDRTWCDTYWGTHGCDLPRGHDGPCDCGCCTCEEEGGTHPHPDPNEPNYICVSKPPYYGPETTFYGDDIPEATRLAATQNPNQEDKGQ